MRCRRTIAVAFSLLLIALLPGCGYTLRGKVIQGQSSGMELVHTSDPRVSGPGLGAVDVSIRRKAEVGSSPVLAGRQFTHDDGEFSMKIAEFGAGWMDEQWIIQARKPGCENAGGPMKLPTEPHQWRVLITLAPGTATPLDAHDEIMQDLERFK